MSDSQTNPPGDSSADAASEAVHVDAPNLAPGHHEAPRIEAPKAKSPYPPGKIMIMSPQRERTWEDFVKEADQEPESHAEHAPRKRRISAVAMVIALAAVTGAIGGSLATAGLGQVFGRDDNSKTASRALEETVMRLDADIAALKISTERAGKQAAAQFGKTTDRLDRVEKAQAEPAAKLAKLSETVAKLGETVEKRAAAPAPSLAPVASVPAKEVTGSIPAPAPAAKPEIARMPTVEGWNLLDVGNGGATIEGRAGVFEVYAGDPVPGLGRVDAIRKQDGRWVVVTSKGLVVAR
ncbi:hypothetical protein [Tardiphaga sp.]|uniref:hypothetical protein n=1 Tax=Tardiphaga sp. TaxID=1926292 RepID=UPI00261AD120|nr:hypothetical protein [Tardiphaga sp.]